MAEYNQAQIAEFFGVARTTVQTWVRNGCPVIQKGGKGKQTILESTAVAQWLQDRAVKNAVGDIDELDEKELRKRKLAAETVSAEVAAEIAKGEVVYIEDVKKIFSEDALNVKAILRQLPQRVAPQIVGETSERKIEKVINQELDAALNELSNRFIDQPE